MIHIFSLSLLWIITSSTMQAAEPSKVSSEFVILVASYNNEKWAIENLTSICHQKSSNPYHVICINDCSTDKTGELMEKYVRENNAESYVTIINNKERHGACENVYNAIHQLIPDHKIVVQVDGDDCLAHNEVLLVLEKYYSNPTIWLTYGSTRVIPQEPKRPMSRKLPDWVSEERKFREYRFVTQHLRTFKAGLFKRVAKKDLMYEGKFLPVASDKAYMFPMLEMASPHRGGPNHSTYIPEILYIYRKDNPINDFRINKKPGIFFTKHIRALKPYDSIDTW